MHLVSFSHLPKWHCNKHLNINNGCALHPHNSFAKIKSPLKLRFASLFNKSKTTKSQAKNDENKWTIMFQAQLSSSPCSPTRSIRKIHTFLKRFSLAIRSAPASAQALSLHVMHSALHKEHTEYSCVLPLLLQLPAIISHDTYNTGIMYMKACCCYCFWTVFTNLFSIKWLVQH